MSRAYRIQVRDSQHRVVKARDHVSTQLDTRAFAYYDVTSGTWQAPSGRYQVLIGKSSEEIELSGDIKLARTVIEKP